MSDPVPEAAGGGKPRRSVQALKGLWPFIRPYRGRMCVALVSLIVASGATLAIGQALRRLIDLGFSAGDGTFLDRYFLALLGVVLLLAAATYGRFYFVSWLGERVIADLRRRVFGHVVRLDRTFFENTPTGEILSRLNADTAVIETVIGSSVSVALRNLLLFLGGVVLLVVTSPKLSALLLLVVPLVLVPILIFGRRVRRLSRFAQDRLAQSAALAGEALNAVDTVQAFTQEASEAARYGRAVEEAFGTARSRIRTRAWLTALVIALVFGAIDAILWAGARDVVEGDMTAGGLAAFVFYAVVTAGALGSLSEVWGDLQRAAGATERLLQLLAVRPRIAAPAAPLPMPRPARSAVRFEDVTFHYPSRPAQAALDGFSLDVERGRTVALVGPSGAGKSTVLQLLLRFHDPDRGRILLDGAPIDRLDPVALRARYALVPQETTIFAGTVADNIRYGRPDAEREAVEAAARAAHADGFIAGLPQGYDTPLGERGVRLSGGQRQRIAIARAVLRDAEILLLDEATSALDTESEEQVRGALEKLMADRTTLVIAHRLSTVMRADRIIVLDQGRIVESGRHDALMAQGGLYARLARQQFDDRTAEPIA